MMKYITCICTLHEDADYTQTEIAKILNVGQRTYPDYESGKTRLPLESMIKLAEFDDVDMNYICYVNNIKKSVR